MTASSPGSLIVGNQPPEAAAAIVQQSHGLTGLHIFTDPEGWRVFAFRQDPKGYQASCEQASGATILAAIQTLDHYLIIGPIAAAKARVAAISLSSE